VVREARCYLVRDDDGDPKLAGHALQLPHEPGWQAGDKLQNERAQTNARTPAKDAECGAGRLSSDRTRESTTAWRERRGGDALSELCLALRELATALEVGPVQRHCAVDDQQREPDAVREINKERAPRVERWAKQVRFHKSM
jgi:hypothetical protein